MSNNNVSANVSRIRNEEVPEFIGQIIDIFEDFLEEKNIVIENSEKSGEDNEAIIYGSDYGNLRESLTSMMEAWNIIDKEDTVNQEDTNTYFDELYEKAVASPFSIYKEYGKKIRAKYPIEGIDDDIAEKIAGFYKDFYLTYFNEEILPDSNVNRDSMILKMMIDIQVDIANLLKEKTPYFIEDFVSGLVELQKKNGLHPIFIFGYVDFDRCMNDAIVRSDWEDALKSVKRGSDLSSKISYRLSDEDLSELAKLHKKNKFRKKIEDLLEDINFHQESGDFANKNYDKYIL